MLDSTLEATASGGEFGVWEKFRETNEADRFEVDRSSSSADFCANHISNMSTFPTSAKMPTDPVFRSEYLVAWVLLSILGLYDDYWHQVYPRQPWLWFCLSHLLLLEVLLSFAASASW